MVIREYQPADCKELTELFYNTVHTINAKDYTKEQLDVWATGHVDLEKWNQSLQEHYSVVAVENKIIVGFGDIDKTGYLDRLFVHANYQGKRIATAICNQLESYVQGDIITHASTTARPFFKKRGYKVIIEQQVKRQGVILVNYVMKKGR
ncbi:MAG: GNAT family N-acetyltransferase [Butyricicoccus pullicaecorum]|nr:GNAT family N-acetyltransferase [Butyricicoccus pullicaecorum]